MFSDLEFIVSLDKIIGFHCPFNLLVRFNDNSLNERSSFPPSCIGATSPTVTYSHFDKVKIWVLFNSEGLFKQCIPFVKPVLKLRKYKDDEKKVS